MLSDKLIGGVGSPRRSKVEARNVEKTNLPFSFMYPFVIDPILLQIRRHQVPQVFLSVALFACVDLGFGRGESAKGAKPSLLRPSLMIFFPRICLPVFQYD